MSSFLSNQASHDLVKPLLKTWRELNLPRYKSEFYRMWHVGHSAGLPHQRTISTIGAFERSPTVRDMRQALLEGLRQRKSIAEILGDHRDLTAPFEFALLELGEQSGSLEQILEMLSDHFNAEQRTIDTVKKQLAYPFITGVAAIFIAPFPILFFGNAVLYLSVVATELILAFAAGGAVLGAAANHYRSRPNVVIGRFCRSLALSIEAGLSINRSAELAVLAAEDAALTRYWRNLPPRKKRGHSPASMFANAPSVPRAVTAALEIADTTGDYNGTVRQLADLYDGGT